MAAKNDSEIDDVEPLADTTASQARRVVAAYATDADECRVFLSMLGIGPRNSRSSGDRRVLRRIRLRRRRQPAADRHGAPADGTTTWKRSPGGLVTALEPLLRRHHGAWIGWPGIPRTTTAPTPPMGSRSSRRACGSCPFG